MAENQLNERQRMAALLRRKTDTILEDWEGMVRARVPGDQALSKSLLRDSLHLLLENLADALASAEWHYHSAKNVHIALEHGRQRRDMGTHGFNQVIDEYAELRKAIIRSVGGDAHSTADGVEVIHAFVDASIKHASGFFAALRHEDERQALVHELDEAKGQRDGYAGERDSIRDYARALEQERQLRSEVISMLGHDMRTPLSAALLAAEMLARRPGAAQATQRAERVIQGLERLDAMLQNLLDADRLRTGQTHPIEVAFCSLSQALRTAQQELTALHGSRFTALFPDDIGGYWDCAALQRLVENLANNAVKYGKPDAPIFLRVEQKGERVELRVHNEGSPIPLKDLPSLFEPHFRTSEAARSSKPGWGLGLAFVKAVAEAHGGTVSVDSDQGRGTTFCVSLPMDCRGAAGATVQSTP